MPVYEYHCQKCGEDFEVRRKMNDEPLSSHPECGGDVEQKLSPSLIQFKGSGWYVTDYGNKPKV